MRTKFLWSVLLIFNVTLNCRGAVLHIGNAQVPLSDVRHTSPSLAISMNGVKYFGALFSDVAPTGTLRLNIGGSQYWLGEYCAPGMYLPPGASLCSECGLGHYCMGGRHRAACSGGIIGCPGTRAVADATATSFSNRLLASDEISENVPPTDLAQWRKISCCSTKNDEYYSTLYNDLSAVNSVVGCAGGALGVGTYLFTDRTGSFCPGYVDPFDGMQNASYTANIIIFDHPVSYKTIHAVNVYWHFIDIDGPDFTNWDFRVPNGSFCSVDIRANVSGLQAIPRGMCVYELQ